MSFDAHQCAASGLVAHETRFLIDNAVCRAQMSGKRLGIKQPLARKWRTRTNAQQPAQEPAQTGVALKHEQLNRVAGLLQHLVRLAPPPVVATANACQRRSTLCGTP